MYKSLSLNLNATGQLRDVYQDDREFIMLLQTEIFHNGVSYEEVWLECIVTDDEMKSWLMSLREQMVTNDILIMVELDYLKFNTVYRLDEKNVIELNCILKNIFDCYINGESQAVNLILNR
jgi:hypothetical protein